MRCRERQGEMHTGRSERRWRAERGEIRTQQHSTHAPAIAAGLGAEEAADATREAVPAAAVGVPADAVAVGVSTADAVATAVSTADAVATVLRWQQ